MNAEIKYPNVGEVLKELRETLPPYWSADLEYPAWISLTHSAMVGDSQWIAFGDADGFYAWHDESGTGNQPEHAGSMEGITDPAEIVSLLWEQIAEVYPNWVPDSFPLCGACGSRHAENDCDLEIEEALDKLPHTCKDFISHPHKNCYTCREASASEGVLPIAEALIRAKVKNVRLEQTGGFTMVVYAYSKNCKSALCFNDEIALWCKNIADDEGEEILGKADGFTKEEWVNECVKIAKDNYWRTEGLHAYEITQTANAFASITIYAKNKRDAQKWASENTLDDNWRYETDWSDVETEIRRA